MSDNELVISQLQQIQALTEKVAILESDVEEMRADIKRLKDRVIEAELTDNG